jgi:hypothetical protein
MNNPKMRRRGTCTQTAPRSGGMQHEDEQPLGSAEENSLIGMEHEHEQASALTRNGI